MTVVDSSVLVAAFARWHERHGDARSAVERADAVPAHAALETYAVLTAIPPPRRAPGGLVLEFLAAHFPAEGIQDNTWLAPLPATYRLLVETSAAERLIGGAVFDGLIAATAQQADATLLTFDRRAAATYRAVGATFELL